MSKLKAILFDMDDTLLDWSRFTRETWRDIEKKFVRGVYDYIVAQGNEIGDYDTFINAYFEHVKNAWYEARVTQIAPHIGQIFLDVAESLGASRDKLDMEACLQVYGWDVFPGVSVFPDVKPMLDKLKGKGIRFGIITNSAHPMSLRDRELRKHGLIDYFPDCRIAAADVGYLKPHRAIFQAALKALDATPEETIVIGDTPEHDIAGAQAAGMRAILRVRQPVPPMLSGLIIPDAAINTFEELPAVLSDWFSDW